MEIDQILAATGILGLVFAVALATLFLLVQPVWAIIDCVDSQRQSDTKLLVSIALLCTWGLGGILYGVFFASSRNLRIFTLAMIALLLLLGVGSIGTCTLGAVRSSEKSMQQAEVAREAAARAIREFQPGIVAVAAVSPFRALHSAGRPMSRSASVAEFTLAGPVLASARDVSDRVRHIAAGPDGLFALTDHDFGAISPVTGRLVKIALDPNLEEGFSWPRGLAFDGTAQKLVILTSHGHARFYRYDPRTAAWELLPAEPRTEPLRGLAWLPETDLLYSLELPVRAEQLDRIQRFNRQGANLGALPLAPPIPLPPNLDSGFQLRASSGYLVLIVPPASRRDIDTPVDGPRIFAIDPETGAVLAPARPGSPASPPAQG